MRITNSGNVGIGTASPGAKLDVLNSNIRASSQLTSAGIEFYPAIAGTPTNAGSIVGVGGSTNIAIMPVGNVGIGTTTPERLLQIKNPGDNGATIKIGGNSTNLVSKRILFGDGDFVAIGEDSTQDDRLEIKAARIYMNVTTGVGIGTNAPAAGLHVNGTAGNSTGVWSNLSDRRLKKDIESIRDALETVERLQPVSFRWKDEKKDAQFGRVRGLIAQDVEKVLPEWIKTDPDGYKRLEPIGDVALLISAIQEQQKQIEELKKEIAKLKNQQPQAQMENER